VTTAPANLAELRKIHEPEERARAALLYIEQRQAAIRAAQQIRDDAIRAMLAAGDGVSATAEAVGVSVSHVKLARKYAQQHMPTDKETT